MFADKGVDGKTFVVEDEQHFETMAVFFQGFKAGLFVFYRIAETVADSTKPANRPLMSPSEG